MRSSHLVSVVGLALVLVHGEARADVSPPEGGGGAGGSGATTGDGAGGSGGGTTIDEESQGPHAESDGCRAAARPAGDASIAAAVFVMAGVAAIRRRRRGRG